MEKDRSRTNLKRFRKLCEKFGVDWQTIDIDSIWDSQQSAEYNWEVIEVKIKELANHTNIDLDKLKAEKREAIEIEEQHYIREQNKQLNKLTKKSTPQIDKFFELPIHYVKMLCMGNGFALAFKGRGGIGKTFTIMKTLKEEGLKLGDNIAYLRGYSTPLALYKFLYNNKDKKVIFLDDIEGIFKDDKGKAILKSALDNVLGKRFVFYSSTSEKLDITDNFELTAKVITCSNDYPEEDLDFKALLDRCIFYEFKFSYKQIIEIMRELVKLPYRKLDLEGRKKVFGYIIDHTNIATNEFSIRTLYKCYDCYIYGRDNGVWKKLVNEIIRPNEDLELIRQLANSYTSVKQQVEEFIEQTGKSRATFFNYKRLLKSSLKV